MLRVYQHDARDEQQERALETEHFLHKEFLKEIMRERVGASLEMENSLRLQKSEFTSTK